MFILAPFFFSLFLKIILRKIYDGEQFYEKKNINEAIFFFGEKGDCAGFFYHCYLFHTSLKIRIQ